jgi:RNA polymerase sigma-70 factor (ECF subfamily)
MEYVGVRAPMEPRKPSPFGESFQDLLEAARAGGEWAWTLIYRDLAPTVLGYLRAEGAHEPEDLLCEVFLHVVRGINTFEGDEDGFRSWVFVSPTTG